MKNIWDEGVSNASLTLARLLATILSWQVVPFLGHELGGYRIVHD